MKKFLSPSLRQFSSVNGAIRKNTIEDCISLVKERDYDSYLAGLLLPSSVRVPFFALRAFNAEISMIKDQVHGNPLTGRIRFQWWKNYFDAVRSDGQGGESLLNQPVAQLLAEQIRKYDLSQAWFDRTLQARHRDLSVDQIESLDELENYAEQAHSSLLYLLLECSSKRDDLSLEAASHLGVSHGIVTYLRGLPYQIPKSKRNMLPLDLCAKHGLLWTHSQGVDSASGPMKEVVFEIAGQANGHLEKGLQMIADSQASARSPWTSEQKALLRGSVVRSRLFLHSLRVADFDVCHLSLLQPYNPWGQMQFKMKILASRLTGSL